jgi:VWFA-related protein
MSRNPACQGELSIDPDSGAVLRVTAQAVHLPRSFPIRQSQTMVEYLSVTLGGNAFLYPSRSLSFIEELSPVTGDRGHFLNRMEYRNFRRFGAESKLIADISGETPATPVAGQFVAPGFSAADSTPISEPPAPGPLVDLTTLDLPSHGLPPVVSPLPTIPPPSIRGGEQPTGSGPVFRARINDVPVRVVVSDDHGKSIGDLRKEDFELFDDEKRQQISGFHVQRSIAKGGDRRTAFETAEAGAAPEPVSLAATNYIVYLFDDLNLSFGDLSLTRAAAERAMKDLAQPATRLAVLTTSGKKSLDFTGDVREVAEVLDHIVPQAVSGDAEALAALGQVRKIENKNGTVVTPQKPVGGDRPEIEAAALRKSGNPAQGRFELQAVGAAVRRLAVMPGDRSIVLVSPGFDLAPGVTVDFEALMNTASRKGIPINTLDTRGVRVLPGFDVEELARPGFGLEERVRQQQLGGARARESARGGLLADLAYGTGGIAIQSSNDFDTAFRHFTNLPEFTYMLIFSPRDLQLDGKFHKLRVGIRNRTGLSVQARAGYLAPAKPPDPAEQADEEIETAVFSREEIREIPLAVQLQSPEKTAKISASMHVGLGTIRFERQNGHNRGRITATVSVFDNDGRYFAGKQERIELDYSDDKLAASIASGTDVRADFDTPAGRYLVRVVIRDEDGHLSSTSSAVEVR